MEQDGRRQEQGPQSLGEILGEASGTLQTNSLTKTSICITCEKEFEARILRILGNDWTSKVCPECQARREEEREAAERAELMQAKDETRRRWMVASGFPRRFWQTSFETWEERPGMRKIVRMCERYADGFSLEKPYGYPSLWLFSRNPGTGKSHLCTAIRTRILQRWDGDPDQTMCPVLYELGPLLLSRVRATYDRRPVYEEGAWQETDEDIYHRLAYVPLLILDDVGDPEKEPPSDHTRRVYFRIINGRYSNNLPIVLASNVGGDELEKLFGRAAWDRLYEMTEGGKCYTLKGQSWRRLRFEHKTLEQDNG